MLAAVLIGPVRGMADRVTALIPLNRGVEMPPRDDASEGPTEEYQSPCCTSVSSLTEGYLEQQWVAA